MDTTPTTNTQETTTPTQEQVDENVETTQIETEPAPVQTEEETERIEKVRVELLRKEFLNDFANKDVGGQKILRNKDNSFKEIVFTKGDEQIAYTKVDLDEMGYLSNNKESFLEGKVRNDLNDLSQQPEQTLDQGDQQTDAEQQPEQQVTEPEEGDTTAQTEDVVTETTVEEEQDQAEPSLTADDITNLISILRPDPNTYIVDARKTQDGTDLDAVEIAVFNDQTQEYDQYEIDPIKARALGIVNRRMKLMNKLLRIMPVDQLSPKRHKEILKQLVQKLKTQRG